MLDSLRQDAAYAARGLRRSPLFTSVAVLSVAIGVGASTAVVTLANTLLLEAPPGIGNPERVVSIGRTQEGRGFDNMSYPNFLDYKAATKTLTDMAIVRMEPTPVSLAGPNGGEPIQATTVGGSFFKLLQARPALGRFFVPEEDQAPGANRAVVLSHKFWQSRYNGDASLVGKPIILNGSPYTVVGVAAPEFHGPFVIAPDVWVTTMGSTSLGRINAASLTERGAVWLVALGRLAEGQTIASAQAELGAIAARLEKAYPDANRGKGAKVTATSLLPGDLGQAMGAFMGLLFGVSMLVLIIASTNVAGMLLARAAARHREIAVRLALGASRATLVRQLVTESVILFVMAGAAGVLLAKWLVSALMTLIPRLPVALVFEPNFDWLVLTFALGLTLATGIATGLVPALQSTKASGLSGLRIAAGGNMPRQRLRSGLLVSQIAFSMLLLVVAALFARTMSHAKTMDAGFVARDVHVATLDFSLGNYDSVSGQRLATTLVERAHTIPAVRSAALSAVLPLSGGGMGLGGVHVAGREPPTERGWRMDWNVVTPDYFATLGIPLVRGRNFTDADRAGAPMVAVLNETFAKALWPTEDALGKRFDTNGMSVTVVGIAKDGKYRFLGEEPRNFLYVPLAQWYVPRMSLLVKTAPGVDVSQSIRRMVADVDRALPIIDSQKLEEFTAVSLLPQRIALDAAGSLGAVALMLALLGVYGVTAYSVAQRTKEIGIRVALGAQRPRVMAMVLRQGLTLAALGVVIGSAAALGLTSALRSLLYGISAVDVIAFGGAALVLSVAATLASLIPARRAASVDPTVALRSD